MINAVPRHQRPAVRLLLDLARRRIPMRGAAKRSFLQALDVARGAARRVGDHLVAAGTLSEIDDIFYLTSDELTRAIPNDIAGQTRWRRERRQQYTRLTIPSHWTETPVPVPIERPNATAAIEPAGVLSGIGVSRGVAEGRARVLSSPDFSVVEPDEILVAPTTDPSWSSIMFISRALVVDIGGPLSHAAVVARELEIPCVVNTGTGTQQLRTGDRVRVDGTAGTVEVLDRAVPYEDGYAGLSQGPLDTTAQPDGPVNPYL
jgi:pyruvate,water dikinase